MFKPEINYEVRLISVVGDSFCFPYLVDLSVKKKFTGIAETYYELSDINGNLLLQVGGSIWQLKKKRTVRDPAGLPIITMRGKVLKFRHRWLVHRGESKDESDLLYTVQQCHTLQVKPRFDVFLANNVTRVLSDYSVIGSYFSESFKVYKGDQLIAEVKEKVKIGYLLGKQTFQVRVYPGVDHVFVMSLLVMLNEIDNN